MLLALLALADAHAAARIAVHADAPVSVAVNGHPYKPVAARYAILCDPGRNKVQVGPKVTYVDVPDGHELLLTWSKGALTVGEPVFVEGLKETDYVDDYYDPDEDPANRPGATIIDPRDISGAQAGDLVGGPSQLTLRAEVEGDWLDVAVNGLVVAELRTFFDAEAVVSLSPGVQRVEVFDPATGRRVQAGQLLVLPDRRIEVVVGAGGLSLPEAPGSWTPDAP